MANWEKLIEEHYNKKKEVDTSLIMEMIDLELENTFQSGVIDGHAGKRLSTKGKKKAGGDPYDEDPPKARSKSAPAGFGVLQEEEIEELFGLGLLEQDFLEESWEETYKKAKENDEWEPMGPANFPIEGNQDYGSNATGSRTPWVMKDIFFPILKPTRIYTLPDRELVDVGTSDEAKFLPPYKMYKAPVLAQKVSQELGTEVTPKTFGVSASQGVTMVQLKSGVKGYIPISKVAKPGGGTQSRVSAGSSSQDAVMGVIAARAAQEGVTASKISSAKPGSTKPDLVVNYNGTSIQFEIKGRKSRGGVISFFDKSARRSGDNSILDAAVEAFVKGISVEFFPEGVGNGDKQSANLGSAMKSTGFSTSDSGLFVNTIDFFQKHVNPQIGFCGDPAPVPKSGAMPPQFNTQDSGILSVIRANILEHLGIGGDNYFSVYTVSDEEAEVYYTGFGDNALGANDFPGLALGRLATYGGCSSGATRIAFKAALKPQGDGLPDAEPPKAEPEN